MATLPSIKNLRYLLAVYKHNNFSKAAKACFVSQSTLSAGISKLEQDLRTTLILRNNKSVVFTSIGKRVVGAAQKTISSMQDLSKIGNADFFESELFVGAIPTITPFILQQIFTRSCALYPQLKLSLVENQSEQLIKQIEAMDIDFALFALPFEFYDHIAFHVLFTEKLHLIHHKNRIITTLDNNCLLLLEAGHCLRDHIIHSAPAVKPEHIAKTHCTNLATVITMVSLDMGVSFLPDMAIKSGVLKNYPDVCVLDDVRFNASRQIGIIYRRNNPQAAHILHFIEALKLN